MQKELRKLILELSYKAGVGHIGPHLSIVDMVWALYDSVLNVGFKNPSDNDRDRFVLSKGHAALALYVVLYKKGFITKKELYSYCNTEGSYLGVHPKNKVAGVDFSSGSLGQGANFAVGAALAAKIQNSQRRVFCLISDGEINEGSVWEAFMFAAQHQLNNLIFLYDNNKQQALARTAEIIDTSNIADRVKSFKLSYHEADGHDVVNLKQLFTKVIKDSKAPVFINAHTISGKGVSFMEATIKWHYKSQNEEQYQQALAEL